MVGGETRGNNLSTPEPLRNVYSSHVPFFRTEFGKEDVEVVKINVPYSGRCQSYKENAPPIIHPLCQGFG